MLFFSEITIAASFREPLAIAVTLAVAVDISASISAALSAYSNFNIVVALSPAPTVTHAACASWSRKILSSPAMNAMGEKISPCRTPRAMSNGSDSSKLPSGCLTRTTPAAAVKI